MRDEKLHDGNLRTKKCPNEIRRTKISPDSRNICKLWTLVRIFSVVLVDFVILFSFNSLIIAKMSSAESTGDESLYPIAVLIDELRNEDVQVGRRVRTDFPRFLQIRLGSESCDQISASPNRLKRAKSRDKTAGSLFTRVYTLVEFSQTKRCFFSFLKQNIQRQMIHQHHYRLHNTIHISLKTR